MAEEWGTHQQSSVRYLRTRALVVDDEENQRTDLAEMLASFGIMPLTATDGQDAIEKLASFDADVIVADLVMPRMDGFDLLRHLSQQRNAPPTIVLTGFGNLEKYCG